MRRIRCRLHSGAAQERLEWDGELARVFVRTPADGAQARRRLVLVLASALGVPPAAVRLLGGLHARSRAAEVEVDAPGAEG